LKYQFLLPDGRFIGALISNWNKIVRESRRRIGGRVWWESNTLKEKFVKGNFDLELWRVYSAVLIGHDNPLISSHKRWWWNG